MKAMRRYSLYQGEGVIVSYKKIGAITTQLYSCMGIVMINPKARRAGLYHYSAETLNKGEVQESIRQMINDLAPERIIVTPAKATWGPESGSLPHDLKAVVSFLAGAWKKPEVGEPHGMSGFSWENDALLVNEGGGGLQRHARRHGTACRQFRLAWRPPDECRRLVLRREDGAVVLAEAPVVPASDSSA